MRDKIHLQSRTATPDGYGNFEAGWQTLASVSARIQPLRYGMSQVEAVIAQKSTGRGFFAIRIRNSSAVAAVNSECRVLNARSDETYNIRQVKNPDERGAYLELICESGVADG